MGLYFTEEQEDLRKLVRNFAGKEVETRAARMDEENAMDPVLLEKMAGIGLMGIEIPVEYGGSGLGMMEKAIVVEELARKDAATAEVIAVHNMAYMAILEHGSEELKKNYLTRAAEGQIAAFALTETQAGSDASALKTKAVKDGDSYIINGTKCFISNMGPVEGDFVTILAITDPEAGAKGLTAFVVDKDAPGFSIGKREDKLGIRAADVSELVFNDCRVPAGNIVGEIGKGFNYFMESLNGGRIGIAAQALGIAQECLSLSVKYMNERIQFGKPISKLQGLQWYIADMATKVEAARALVYEAASDMDKGENIVKIAAIAKYYASEIACEVSDRALQIYSGYGYMKDYPIEKMFRDARILPIYEGTSEIQKLIIAREVLKGER